MAWLWSTWQEFSDYVQPTLVTSRGLFGLAEQGSWFDTEERLIKAVDEVNDALGRLNELGFRGSRHALPPGDPRISLVHHRWLGSERERPESYLSIKRGQ